MKLVTLSEIADVFNGKTPSKAEQRESGHPVLKIKDINEHLSFKGGHESFVDKELAQKFADKLIQIDDTLILNAAHNADYVGSKTYLAQDAVAGAMPTGEWLLVRPNKNVADKRFIHHWITSSKTKKKLKDLVKGIHLYPKDVANLSLQLPPLEEQKRIAAILDKADSLRRKRQQAIRLADDFLRAVFFDMFGDPVSNSRKWPEKEIYEIAKITTGNTPSRDIPENFGTAIEWIKSDNINTPSHWVTKATEGLSEQGLSLGRTAPAGSTLMTCIAGSPSCIGNVAMADREVAFNQQINALTPFEGAAPEFLYGLLLYSKQRVQDASTNSMKGMVSKGALARVRLIWPPADWQSAYAVAFRKITALREKQLESDSSPLFSSLQDSLLS